MRYRLIDGKPVPAKLYDELRALGFGQDIVLTSGLRTQDAVNWARRQGATLSSQPELWNAFRAGHGNPANPPGQSTHELRSDGVAYPGPRGRPLRYWQLGIDCWLRNGSGSAVATVRARAARRGWIFTLTYPGAAGETQHGNFRREPRLTVFKALRKGSRGPRVRTMTARLAYLGDLPGVSPKTGTGGFGPRVERGLKAFQRHWHLQPDGVYGKHTEAQLKVAVRARKAKRRAQARSQR